MRKLLYGLIGLVVLTVAAVLILPSFIDLRPFVAPVLQSVKESTGREVRIGAIGLSLLPAPTATIGDLRVANIQGAANPDMVKVKSVQVRVALFPLLTGKVQVESIAIVDPVIEIETLRDGRSSLDFPKSEQAAGGGTTDIRLDSLEIKNGLVVLRDAAGGLKRVEAVNMTASAQSLSGPFRAKGSANAMGVPINLDVTTGLVTPGRPASVNIAFEGAGAKVQFQGNVTGAQAANQPAAVAGKFSLTAANLAAFADQVNAGGGTLPPLAAQSFSMEGNVKGNANQIQVPDIVVKLGDMSGSGAFALGLTDRTTIQLALNMGRIDLDKIIAGAAPPPRPAPVPQTGAAPAAPKAAAPGAATPGAPPPPVIPANLVAAIDIGIEAIAYRGQAMQRARFQLDVVNGAAVLKQLSAQLPAGSSILVANLPLPLGGPAPAMPDGRIEAHSDDLRSVLGWLGTDLSTMPQGRLTKFNMKANVRSDGQSVQINNLDTTLDSTRLTGGVTMAFRDRPAFGVRANIDRINLDAYMPVGPAKPARPAAPAAPAASPLDQFKVLETFDLTLLAEIGSMTLRDTPVTGVKVDLELVNGKLTVKEASVRDLAGAQAAFNLAADKLSTAPAFSTGFNLRAPDSRRFLKFLSGQDTALPQQVAGQLIATGTMSGTPDQVKIDTSMQGLGGSAKVAGNLAQLTQAAPKIDLSIDANFPEFGPVLAAFASTKGDQKLGPFAMKSHMTNTGPDTITLRDTEIRAFGGELAMTGTISQLTAPEPAVDLGLSMKLPSLRPLLAAFNPDPQLMTTADQLGALTFTGKAVGNSKKVSLRNAALSGLGGSVQLNGDVFEAGKQYDLIADIKSFNLGPLLAALPGQVMTAQGAKQLGPANGKLGVKGKLDNLSLRMENLAMQGFGGSMAMNGSVTDAMDTTRQLDLTFDINNVHLGQMVGAFPKAGASPALAQGLGPAVIKGGIKGSGASPTVNLQQAQVQAFGGTASVSGSVVDAAGANAKYDLTASANMPNLYQVLTAFYKPAMQITGPLQFDKVHLVGDAKKVTIENLNGKLGPVGLSGQGSFSLQGPRPKLDMQLKTTGELFIDAFLPAEPQKRSELMPYWRMLFPDLIPASDDRVQLAQQQQNPPPSVLQQLLQPKAPAQPAAPAPAPKPAAPAAAPQAAPQQPAQPAYQAVQIAPPPQGGQPDARWSRVPIDVEAIKAYDLNLHLAGIQSVRFKQYSLQNLNAKVVNNAGVLSINEITATAYGGALTGQIGFNANNVPQANIDVSINRANAHDLMKAMTPPPGNDRLDGWLSTNAKFQVSGRNEAEMVSTLTGGAALSGEVKARITQQERMQVGMVQQLGGLLGGQTDTLAQTMTTLSGGMSSGLVGMLSFVGLLMVDEPGKISGNVDFKNGLMTERDLQIVNNQVLLATTGWVSLPLYRQDFAVEAYNRAAPKPPAGQAQQPYIAAQLRGPLDEKRNVRVYGERVQRGGAAGMPAGLSGTALQDALKGNAKPADILKNILGGQPGATPAPAAGAPAAPAPAPAPAPTQQQQLKGLMDQLLKPKQ